MGPSWASGGAEGHGSAVAAHGAAHHFFHFLHHLFHLGGRQLRHAASRFAVIDAIAGRRREMGSGGDLCAVEVDLIHHQGHGVFQCGVTGIPHGEMTSVTEAFPLLEIGPVANGDNGSAVLCQSYQIVYHGIGGVQLRPLQKVGQGVGGQQAAFENDVAHLQGRENVLVLTAHRNRSF